MSDVEVTERSEKRKQWAVFAVACCVSLLVANNAAAQDLPSLAFLDMAKSFVIAVVKHEVFGALLFGVFTIELIMFGLKKNVTHFFGMLVPGLCAAAWAGVGALFQQITGLLF